MADLNPLIRLNKFQLEEKQRFLARLYADMEALEIEKKAILDSVESEKQAVDSMVDDVSMMVAFLNYFQKSKQAIEERNKQISSLEIKIGRAIEEMRLAFGELKKIEITRDRRLQEIAQENKKREDALFSEIALEIYRRRE
jgi:hypothetical protein